eukprot:scaffold3859_cov77-Skeletonema_dohrnii-CCMP3373.AAC.1
MEQSANDALLKDAQIEQLKEMCAIGMGQSTSDAAGCTNKALRGGDGGGCVRNMEQSSKDTAAMDAQTMPSKEECALSMAQRSNYAAAKDFGSQPCSERFAR